ncbi:MAG: nucleotide pyrophosphohydrolase [Actinobacteria bacterium]|nr:nucleotide pyrophosphohydrolase [Actinomycetota bacterium]
MEIRDFQELLGRTFLDRDRRRGLPETFAWLVEEMGELSRALRSGDRDSLDEEFADVLAWLASLANLCDIDLQESAGKYAHGCPRCGSIPCSCPE